MPVPGGIKTGMITKPYGLKGQVNFMLEPNAVTLIKIDNPLFIDIDGQRIPFFVEDFEQVSDNQAIVKFEFINSIEKAREYNGCEVYSNLEKNATSQKSDSNFNELVGYKAFDQHLGYLGTITDFMQNDINPIFIVDFKEKELLIPAIELLILKVDHKDKSILFELPEGLTEV